MTGTTSLNGMNVVSRGAAAGSRTVLITGVSKGLGRALALELAKRGHAVIGCSRAQDKLNSLQSELSASSDSNSTSSDKHLFVNADVVSVQLVSEFVYVCCSVSFMRELKALSRKHRKKKILTFGS